MKMTYSELPLDISTWDETCMQCFIKTNAALFHVFASRYVDDSCLIDDFLQEAYIKLWTRRKSIGKVTSIHNYFYSILRNTILDKWAYFFQSEKSERNPEHLDISSDETFMQHLIEAESANLIAQAIQKLSPQSQQVIEMTIDGKSMQEIADALQLTVNSVKTVKYRAIKRLSALLSKEDFLLLLVLVFIR
ncbi:RNA polymerase sigma factor [Bacteroides timonensis]|uniref:RNA polymerase sigma factor n=1 Tax=Bacteroides timonensis TaxID=1470345 RepID=UPI0004BB9969|nr:sigma-70 family RNA polymerase sigma factor [Bacteroides timonensis]